MLQHGQAFCLPPAQYFAHFLLPSSRGYAVPRLCKEAVARLSAATTTASPTNAALAPHSIPDHREQPQAAAVYPCPVALRDIFGPKRLPLDCANAPTVTAAAAAAGRSNERDTVSTTTAVGSISSKEEKRVDGGAEDGATGGNTWDIANIRRDAVEQQPLHRLDRLQEVVDLALEGRQPGETWACADIGADHGLLAICLHANGANVIASDRAGRPLNVARENCRAYLRHAETLAARTAEPAPAVAAAPSAAVVETGNRTLDVSGRQWDGRGEAGRTGVDARLPRLDCRLGEGLGVLEKGEVDTVCIAGMGVKTMIQILSEGGRDSSSSSSVGKKSVDKSGSALLTRSALSDLKIDRLVLQPMDARLEYVHNLRMWLRENGWRITQESIASILGKGGRRAFLTLRADSTARHRPPQSKVTTTILSDWPGGHQEGADWLGEFLPARATTDSGQLLPHGNLHTRRGVGGREEALTFLAYLKHQRNWLRAIERARRSSSSSFTEEKQEGGGGGGSGGKGIQGRLGDGLDQAIAAVEESLSLAAVAATTAAEMPSQVAVAREAAAAGVPIGRSLERDDVAFVGELSVSPLGVSRNWRKSEGRLERARRQRRV